MWARRAGLGLALAKPLAVPHCGIGTTRKLLHAGRRLGTNRSLRQHRPKLSEMFEDTPPNLEKTSMEDEENKGGGDSESFEGVTPVLNHPLRSVDRNVNPPMTKLTFLGTSSMAPTKSRNVSSVALQLGGSTWLFDVGEGTQHQIMRCKQVRVTTVNRIFITHLHGDHFYGLPGILCSLCNAGEKPRDTPLEIIGPPGLRHVLRTVLEASAVYLNYRYVVHELHRRERKGGISKQSGTYLNKTRWQDCHPQENPGYDIIANINGEWENIPIIQDTNNRFTVHAGLLKHSPALLTVGYVIQEQDYPGKMLADDIKDQLRTKENIEFFKESGIRNPLRLLGKLKAGESIQLHDRVVHPSQVLGPSKKGRKIVILGDTYDPSAIARLAVNANVLVHESTNAYLPEVDSSDGNVNVSHASVLRKTLSHGHSTPEMAGSFANAINCKHLVLTHLSPRYRYPELNEDEEESMEQANALLKAIQQRAQDQFPSGKVDVAHDFMEVEIPGEWEGREDSLDVRQLHLDSDTEYPLDSVDENSGLSPEESLARAKVNSRRYLGYLTEPVSSGDM